MTVEQLQEFGMERMSEEAIRGFLEAQGMGVLALPDADAPYLLPLSFGYDGADTLYFTYIVGAESQKARLSADTTRARFLTYNAESPFSWRSVVLTGQLAELPQSNWGDHTDAILDNAWHPAIFDSAIETMDILVYQFAIEDWSGVRHSGLPPGLDADV